MESSPADIAYQQALNQFLNTARMVSPSIEQEPTGVMVARGFTHSEPVYEEPEQESKFIKLRPMKFEDFIGQDRHVKRLQDAITAAQMTNQVLPHIAFISEAGTGKTSLAACCASLLKRKAYMTVGSALTDMDMVKEFMDHVDGGIAFIDEAHDLDKGDVPIVSGLLPLLEDWKLFTPSGATIVKKFTCIMATTYWGRLDSAIRSRMGIPYEFDKYTLSDMEQIALYHAGKIRAKLTPESAREIGTRSRKNPRRCLNLIRECNNIAVAQKHTTITQDHCNQVFDSLGITEAGLSKTDLRLLEALAQHPMSLTRCANYVGLDRRTFEEEIETFLFRNGFITTSSKGREITPKGRDILSP